MRETTCWLYVCCNLYTESPLPSSLLSPRSPVWKAGQRQSLPLYRWGDWGLERDGQPKDTQLATCARAGSEVQAPHVNNALGAGKTKIWQSKSGHCTLETDHALWFPWEAWRPLGAPPRKGLDSPATVAVILPLDLKLCISLWHSSKPG